MTNGWIKLHNKFLGWGWLHKPEMVSIFIYLLLTANYEEKVWQGQKIKRGQTIIGREKLSKILGLSPRTIRTCMTRLKTTSEITTETTNRYTLVSILNYDKYQDKTTSKTTSETTNKRPANDQQTTTPKEVKKIRSKEDKKNTSPVGDPLHLEVKELFDHYTVEYAKKITAREKPIFNWGRCEKSVKPFLKSLGKERLKKLIDLYLDTDDKFYKNSAWSLELFLSATILHALNAKCK